MSIHPKSQLSQHKSRTTCFSCTMVTVVILIFSTVGLTFTVEDYMNQLRYNLTSLSHNTRFSGTLHRCSSGHATQAYPVEWKEAMKYLDNKLAAFSSIENIDPADYSNTLPWQPPNQLMQNSGDNINPVFIFSSQDKFECPPGKITVTLHWHALGNTENREDDVKMNITHTIQLLNLTLNAVERNLVWTTDNGRREVFYKNNFCVWEYGSKWVTFKACVPDCSGRKNCVKKCCLPGQVIDLGTWACKPTSLKWRPTFYKSAQAMESDMDNNFVKFAYGLPNCKSKYPIENSTDLNFKLLSDGTLIVEDREYSEYSSVVSISRGEFCIDRMIDSSKKFGNNNGLLYEDQIVIACSPEKKHIFMKQNTYGISVIFLLLTDVFAIFPWKRKPQNIHKILQVCFITSLLALYAFYAIPEWLSIEYSSVISIQSIEFIHNSMYLSVFCWLTALIFESTWQLSNPPLRKSDNERLLVYIGFAIALPLFICGMRTYLTLRWKLESIAVGVLLTVDSIIFVNILLYSWKMHYQREPCAVSQAVGNPAGKESLWFHVVLFIVMGIFWAASKPWIVVIDYIYSDLTEVLCGFIISYQGVVVFFVFACKLIFELCRTNANVATVANRTSYQISDPFVSTEL